MSSKSRKHNGVNFSKTTKHNKRRESALKRLESQLDSGHKTMYDKENGALVPTQIKLSESDITRINKEIEILKSRIS